MQKQERRFTLAEVHTKMGAMGEIRLDQALLDVLSIKPGDSIVFSVDKDGIVTVKGEKQDQESVSKPAPTEKLKPPNVTQSLLFSDGTPPPTPKRRARKR